jgi:hypothetical protein
MVCEGLHRYHASALRHAKSQRNKEFRDGGRIRSSSLFIHSNVRFVKAQDLAIAYGLSPLTFRSYSTPTRFAPSNHRLHTQHRIGCPEITDNHVKNTQKTPQTALAVLMLFSIRTLPLMADERNHSEATCKLSKCINKPLTSRIQSVL